MKKYFRITLKGYNPSVFYDYEVPDEAKLPQFWSNIIGAGYLVTDRFIISADQIASIAVVTMDVAQQSFVPRVVN